MKLRVESPNILRLRLSPLDLLTLQEQNVLFDEFRWFRNFKLKIKLLLDKEMKAGEQIQLNTEGPLDQVIHLGQADVDELKLPSKKGIETKFESPSGAWILGIEVDLKG